MQNQKEIWKKIPNYENYQVSNLGNVKSLRYNRERILKPSIAGAGYLYVVISENKVRNFISIHVLVSISFLNHTPNRGVLSINHINLNKLDNRLCNLEIVTVRENTNKKHLKSTSKYTGVCWDNVRNKWKAGIKIKKKSIHLGYFENEIEASKYYQNAIISIKNNVEIIKYKKIFSN